MIKIKSVMHDKMSLHLQLKCYMTWSSMHCNQSFYHYIFIMWHCGMIDQFDMKMRKSVCKLSLLCQIIYWVYRSNTYIDDEIMEVIFICLYLVSLDWYCNTEVNI